MSFKKVALFSAATVSAALAVGGDYDYSYNRAPSVDAPVSNPPQLIVLGSDDNTSTEGMNWILDYLKSKQHADGSALKMSFYSNTKKWEDHQEPWGPNGSMMDISADQSLIDVHKRAYAEGHEVTNHTETHIFCIEYDWQTSKVTNRNSEVVVGAEIDAATQDFINLAGIKEEHMKGFRTPYLAYSDTTFSEMKRAGFTYDCSVNEGIGQQPGAYYWPYTLDTQFGTDNYAPGNENSYWNSTYDAPIRKHSGLWELPCYAWKVVDSDVASLDEELGYESGGQIAALDYNIWAQANMDKDKSLRTLKNTFDKMYAGNRTPMTVGLHSQYYIDYPEQSAFVNIQDHNDRRWVVEQFIDYALSKGDDVYFVSGAQAIKYCMNPVSASSFDPDAYGFGSGNGGENQAPTNISLSKSTITEGETTVGTLTTTDDGGSHTYRIVTGSFVVDGSTLKTDGALSVGDHKVTIETKDSEGLTYEKEFTVTVKAAPVAGDPVEVLALAQYYYAYHDSSDADCNSKYTDEKDGDKITKVIFDLAIGGGVYSSGEGSYPEKFSKVTDVKITYTATENFTVALPMSSITDGGVHSIGLSKDDTSKKFAVSELSQPSWAKTKKEFDGSEVSALTFSLADGVAAGKIEITSIVLYGYPEPVVEEPKDTVELIGHGELYSYAYNDETDGLTSKVTLDTGSSSIDFKGATIELADNKEIDGQLVYAYGGVGFGNWKDDKFPQTTDVKSIEVTYKSTAGFVFGVKEEGSDVAYNMQLPASEELTTVKWGVNSLKNEAGETGVDMSKVNQLDLALYGSRSGTIEVASIKFIYVGDAVSLDVPVQKNAAPVFAGISNGKMNIGVPSNGRYGITMYSLKGQKLGHVSADLTAGMNAVSMSNISLGRQMMIVQIAGNGINAVHKVMIK